MLYSHYFVIAPLPIGYWQERYYEVADLESGLRSAWQARKQNTERVTAATPRPSYPTIATIAVHMGLSRATVTHVLNGWADEMRIRPETQLRVQNDKQVLT